MFKYVCLETPSGDGLQHLLLTSGCAVLIVISSYTADSASHSRMSGGVVLLLLYKAEYIYCLHYMSLTMPDLRTYLQALSNDDTLIKLRELV